MMDLYQLDIAVKRLLEQTESKLADLNSELGELDALVAYRESALAKAREAADCAAAKLPEAVFEYFLEAQAGREPSVTKLAALRADLATARLLDEDGVYFDQAILARRQALNRREVAPIGQGLAVRIQRCRCLLDDLIPAAREPSARDSEHSKVATRASELGFGYAIPDREAALT